MKQNRWIPALLALTAASAGAAVAPSIGNGRLTATLDSSAMLQVRDLAAGLDWRQTVSGDAFQVTAAETRRGPGHQEIVATLAGAAGLRMSVILPDAAAEIRVKLYAPKPLKFAKTIAYPHAFTAPRSTAELVLPYQEGILLKLDDAKPLEIAGDLFSLSGWPPGGLSMPWFGLVDGEAGMLAVVATPFDADVRLKWAGDALAAHTEWLPSFGEWR